MEEVQIEFEGSERFCNWFCGPSWWRFTFFWTAAAFDVYCLRILKSCNETQNGHESTDNDASHCRDLTYDSTWALKMKSCTLKRSSDVVYKEISAGSDQMFLEKKWKIRSYWFRNAPTDCQTGFFFFVIKKIDLSIFGYFFSTCDTLYSDSLIQQLQICNQNNLMCRRVAMNSMSWQTFSRKFRHSMKRFHGLWVARKSLRRPMKRNDKFSQFSRRNFPSGCWNFALVWRKKVIFTLFCSF